MFKTEENGKKPYKIIFIINLQKMTYIIYRRLYIYSKIYPITQSQYQLKQISLKTSILKNKHQIYQKINTKMIYHNFPNFIDSYFFMTFINNSICFNYHHCLNQLKISSNIILVKNSSSNQDTFQEENSTNKLIHSPCKTYINQIQSVSTKFGKKMMMKPKTSSNEVSPKKKKKISKSNKKVEMVQKQGRNSHSNILRKFFKLLSSNEQFFPIVGKIIKKYNFSIDSEGYFEQMRVRNVDHRNYIRIKEIEKLFSQSDNAINKITRILFQYYLSSYYIQHLLSSKKTDSKSIIFHLKGKRTIRQQILLQHPSRHQSCQHDQNNENLNQLGQE